MDGTADRLCGDSSSEAEALAADPSPAAGRGSEAGRGAPRVLVVDADRTLLELLGEWLAVCGCDVVEPPAGARASSQRFDLIVVDVPFPRQGGSGLLRRVAGEHPGAPILALSSNFFPGVESSGAVARTLGVARVLPMPVTRDALVTAVRQLLCLER